MKAKDLTGEKIGRLTVICYSHTKNGRKFWNCECECGNKTCVRGSHLTSKNSTKSCGCLIKEASEKRRHDVIGKKFNNWYVEKYDKKINGNIYYICKCSCGKRGSVPATRLISGESKSCGCLRSKIISFKNKKDLMDCTFGDLHVEECLGVNKHGNYLYSCRCKCGNIIVIPQGELVRRKDKTCGKCKLIIRESPHLIDEWNFDRNKDIDINKITIGSMIKVWWICKKCKHNWKASICNRAKKNTGCPKCRESKGEKIIDNVLSINNIVFYRQYKFSNCTNIKKLRFDFYIPSIKIAIEYQGEGHFIAVDIWGGENGLENRKKRDLIKKRFCEQNGIKLLEINYNERDNIEQILIEKVINK